MIVGIGVDVVGIDRFAATLARTPSMVDRLFTPGERDLPVHSLAGRFAAKEALAKALGAPGNLVWTDAEVVRGDAGRPALRVVGTVARRARELAVVELHVSISHDAGIATAMVVAEAHG